MKFYFNSFKVGIESPAPSLVVDKPAILLAKYKHSFISFPSSNATEKPPLKASPAPVVSIALTLLAFI